MEEYQNIVLNIDHKKAAMELIKFKTDEQRLQARKEFEEYLIEKSKDDAIYTAELVRRVKSDKDFKEKMLVSVIQLSCLITSTLIETILVYDDVFDAVKKNTKNDYDEIKSFKMYLLNKFSIEELQDELGFVLDDDILMQFQKRFQEIKEYFSKY